MITLLLLTSFGMATGDQTAFDPHAELGKRSLFDKQGPELKRAIQAHRSAMDAFESAEKAVNKMEHASEEYFKNNLAKTERKISESEKEIDNAGVVVAGEIGNYKKRTHGKPGTDLASLQGLQQHITAAEAADAALSTKLEEYGTAIQNKDKEVKIRKMHRQEWMKNRMQNNQ